jgi:hypothetical protein
MISRIMLSLRKAADSRQEGWTLGGPATNGSDLPSMIFFRPERALIRTDTDGIVLDTYPDSQTATR